MPSVRERDVFYSILPENLRDYIRSEEFLDPIETTLGVRVYYPNNPPLDVGMSAKRI